MAMPVTPDVLREAGAQDADMLVAVTNTDETNMAAAKSLYLFNTRTELPVFVHLNILLKKKRYSSQAQYPLITNRTGRTGDKLYRTLGSIPRALYKRLALRMRKSA